MISCLVVMWHNPYSGVQDRKAQLAEANRQRVMRQKKEREFLRGMHHNPELSNLDDVEAKLEEQQKARLLDMRTARSASHIDVAEEPAEQMVAAAEFRHQLRCFWPTQGGSTLWTGENDGCLGIRNGANGDLVYRIAATEGVVVDVLYQSTSSHMWVGLSDGTVRIYDQLVFIQLFEGKQHGKGVTCFMETFDGKMFSAGLDGSMVKWDSEAHEFEAMMALPASDCAVRAMASYGYNLFVASDCHDVKCIDVETGAQVRLYSGHEGAVAAVAVADGYLFSGSSDNTVRVWQIDTAEELAVLQRHNAPVTSVMVDDIAHTIWSADASGTLHVWHTAVDKDFGHLRSFAAGCGQVRAMHGFVAVDASKMWSLGSNGVNFVWHTATNRVEQAGRQAVLGMEHIIEQDAKELERWTAVIENLRIVAERLKSTMGARLGEQAAAKRTRVCYFQWLQFVYHSRAAKKRPAVAALLERATTCALSSRYFHAWARWLQQRVAARSRRSLALAMEKSIQQTRIRNAYRTMRVFYSTARSRALRVSRAQALANATDRSLLHQRLTQWLELASKRRRFRKRDQLAASINCLAETTVLRTFFIKWLAHRQFAQRSSAALSRANALCASQIRSSRGATLAAWRRSTDARVLHSHRSRIALLVAERVRALTASAAFGAWMRYALSRREVALRREIDDGRARLDALDRDVAKVAHLTRRQQLGHEVQALIDLAKENIARKRGAITATSENCVELQAAIEDKRSNSRQHQERTVQQHVDDLIARLKSKMLNMHQDFAHIAKTNEKAKTLPATRVFLEAHQAVKRIVVQLTNQPVLHSDELWPLTERMVRKMPKHHAESILVALKNMIIAFDIMSPNERQALETDNEIAINAKWLNLFGDICVEIRTKTLGASALRVK